MTTARYTTIETAHAYLNYAESVGVSATKVFAEAGLVRSVLQSDTGYIAADTLQKLLHAILTLSGDPLVGLRHSRMVQANSYDILGYVAVNCDNLQQSMERVIQYEGLVGNLGYTQIIPQNDNILVSWHCNLDDPIIRRQTLESVIGCWIVYTRQLIRLDEQALEVWFEHSPPENKALLEEYHSIFQCQVKFEKPYTGILVTQQQWQMPFPQANAALREAMEKHADDTIQRLQNVLGEKDSVKEKCLKMLRIMQRSGRSPSKTQLANHLGLSERTLQRRLDEENTRFMALVHEVRLEKALQLLAHSELPIPDIAEEVGYQEVRSFYRAIKKLTGKTARQIRQAASSID